MLSVALENFVEDQKFDIDPFYNLLASFIKDINYHLFGESYEERF